MIVISKERFLPSTPNVMVLNDGDNYYYVHRDVYDMAVVLTDRHDFDSLAKIIDKEENNRDEANYFFMNAPVPLKILAPFISLVDGELEQDMELLTGVLHAISGALNLRQYVKMKKELRKSVSFSLSVKDEYELAWDRFFNTSIPYDERAALGARMPGYLDQPPMMFPQYFPAGQAPSAPIQQPQEAVTTAEVTHESKAALALDGEQNRSKEAGALDTGDVIDESDITNHPDWTEVAPGVYYNEVTGDTAFVESPELEAAEDALFADLPINKTDDEKEEAKSTLPNHESVVSDEEKNATRSVLGLQLKKKG